MKPGSGQSFTLKPGESFSAELFLPVPEWVRLALEAGARLQCVNGPVEAIGPNQFHRLVDILLDGKWVAQTDFRFNVKPKPWYTRLWNAVRRRPQEVPDMRLEFARAEKP